MTEPHVFVNCRRKDAPGSAGRLNDDLGGRFGEHTVFREVHMRPGIDFVDEITRAPGSYRGLLAVIGPRWAAIAGPDGNAAAARSGRLRTARDRDGARARRRHRDPRPGRGRGHAGARGAAAVAARAGAAERMPTVRFVGGALAFAAVAAYRARLGGAAVRLELPLSSPRRVDVR